MVFWQLAMFTMYCLSILFFELNAWIFNNRNAAKITLLNYFGKRGNLYKPLI